MYLSDVNVDVRCLLFVCGCVMFVDVLWRCCLMLMLLFVVG